MKKIIYGLGFCFEEYLVSTDDCMDDVVALVDKDESKQGKSIKGIRVLAPKQLLTVDFDNILISSKEYFEEIKAELMELGISGGKICPLEYKTDKYSGELAYWRNRFNIENRSFMNKGYRDLFLAISEEKNDEFMKEKVVADFGCGPRGSLAWTNLPKVKIGIDILANEYMRFFGDCLAEHGMIYLSSDEYRIPLPSNYVDVLSTINSLDHVAVLDNMVNEICRVLKPGGLFLGSFNLNEPKTQCEPQTLTEELLDQKLLCRFEIISRKIAKKGVEDTYSEIRMDHLVDHLSENEPGEMWVKAILK